jgi:uncharacterized membrane protein
VNPDNPRDLLTIALMLLLAMWGGIVNYIGRIRAGLVRSFRFFELIGEMVISSFSGLIIYFIALHLQVDPLLTVVLVAIAGHEGARTIFLLQRAYTPWVERVFGAQKKERRNGKKN